jgi:hypothetical protein
MTNNPSSAGSDTVAATLVGDLRPEHVKVRRRRARQGHRSQERWTVRSRRRAMQSAFVCAGALLLMAAAVYFTLAHESSGPEGSARGILVGARSAA